MKIKKKYYYYWREGVYFLLLLSAIILLIIFPEIYSRSIKDGLLAFFNNVVPVLFPFFVLTKLMTGLSILKKAGNKLSPLMKKVYNTEGTSGMIFVISAISGYPVGARLIYDMYSCGNINEGEAARMTSFCSVSGPMFIIGCVGILLNNKLFGSVILISHFAGAIINGLIYRRYGIYNTKRQTAENNEKNMSDSVYQAVVSILIVGGYIAIFFMLCDMLFNIGVLNPVIYLLNFIFPENISRGLAMGIIEMTRGCIELCKNQGLLNALMCCAVISWGGISVNMQAYTYLKRCNVKIGYFLLTKITHCIISTTICYLLLFSIF